MAQWVPFTALVAILTVLLLLLSRQSQRLLEQATTETPRSTPTDAVPVDTRQEGDERRTDEQKTGEETTAESSDGAEADRQTASSEPHGSGPDSQPLPSEFELTPKALLTNVGLTQGLVLGIILAAAWYFSIPKAAFGVTDEATNSGLPAVVAGVLFGIVLWVGNELATTVADAVGAAYDETVRELLAADTPGGMVALFVVVLPIIAVAEELLFRAALIGVPAAGFDISPWLLAIVASVAFALGHGAQGRVGIVVTGLLGFVLALGYIISGSLLLVIVAHYVINALEFFIHEYLEREGLFTGSFVGEY